MIVISLRSPGQRKRQRQSRRCKPSSEGFTLIEIIVILAVISILVAILTPTVLKYIDEARISRAEEDVKTINAMFNDLIKDTGEYPGNKLPVGKPYICGSGTQPSAGIVWCTAANSSSLSNHLFTNDPDEDGTPNEASDDYRASGKFRWKGPYLQANNPDPWGNAYALDASTLVGGNTSPTWIVSAGPDGIFQTSPADTSLSGDDIGSRIK
jgi:type II secretory pathway pseudopilin PulG